MTSVSPGSRWPLRCLGLAGEPADLRFAWRVVGAVLAIYVVSFAIFYPRVTTNVDEAAYVAQAVLLLEPGATIVQRDAFTGDPVGVGMDSYPLGTALITAPLVAVFGWRAAFAVTCLSLLVMVVLTGRWIASEGRSPAFALLFFGFPSVLVMGRVAMSDVPSGALVALGMVLFWRGLDRGCGWWLGAGWVAGASWALRATNPILFVPLFLGTLLRRERKAWALLVGGLVGLSVRLISHAAYFGDALFERSSYRFEPQSLDERLPLYLFGLMICVPGGLLFSMLYRGRRRPELLITIAGFVLVYLFQRYGTIETSLPKRVVLALRYLIPLLPVLIFTMSESVPRLWKQWVAKSRTQRRAAIEWASALIILAWFAGAGLVSAAIHPTFAAWSSTQVEMRSAIQEFVPADGVLLTNKTGTMKFVAVLERRFRTLDTAAVAPDRIPELVARHGEVFLVVLDRNDSAWWVEMTHRNADYVESLPTRRELLTDLRPSSADRLRIWRLSG